MNNRITAATVVCVLCFSGTQVYGQEVIHSGGASVVQVVRPGPHQSNELGDAIKIEAANQGLGWVLEQVTGASLGILGGAALSLLTSAAVGGVNSDVGIGIVGDGRFQRGAARTRQGEPVLPVVFLRVGDDICDHSITIVVNQGGRLIGSARILDPGEMQDIYGRRAAGIGDALVITGREPIPLLGPGNYQVGVQDHCVGGQTRGLILTVTQ